MRWLHQLGRSHLNPEGLTVYRAGVVQEFTARKVSELALGASTDLIRRTGQMAMFGGWELVLDGIQLICSDQLLRIHDLKPGSILTLADARDAYVPGARRRFAAAAEAAIANGAPWDLELSLITEKGRTIWVRSRGQAVVKNGVVHRLTGTVQEITLQHKSQEQLRLLEKCIYHLNDIVLITKAEPFNKRVSRIVFVNDAFERRTGYSRGEVSFWVGIDADISEIKTVEAALRLSNQELEAFAYSVSHDLRSPLNPVDGFSRLLSKQVDSDSHLKARHYLSRIQAGVAQMGRLIEDLLALSHVSRMQLRYEEVDLSTLDHRIVDDWKGRQPER